MELLKNKEIKEQQNIDIKIKNRTTCIFSCADFYCDPIQSRVDMSINCGFSHRSRCNWDSPKSVHQHTRTIISTHANHTLYPNFVPTTSGRHGNLHLLGLHVYRVGSQYLQNPGRAKCYTEHYFRLRTP